MNQSKKNKTNCEPESGSRVSAVKPPSILFTVDVEDWFQVENFKSSIPFSSWDKRELRVETNVHRLLDLLDGKRATFFVLGWIAERLPDLVREIDERGHEVASHGFYHHLPSNQSFDELKMDLVKSRKLLEDITGNQVYGYRAPSFAINEEVLKIVEQSGYYYDSSFNSFDRHGRYGTIDLSSCETTGIAARISDSFFELPVSNLKINNQVFPWGGGGYFRLMPFPFFKTGVKSILKADDTYLFYTHPWETDADQPRVESAPPFFKFRHYVNLGRAEKKMKDFLSSFMYCRFESCSNYLKTFCR